MSDLSNIEKMKIEKLFGMGSGYVLDFSNRTFQEFVYDSLGIDIYDDKYEYASGSKANRLRSFWNKESNHVVATMLDDLLEYWRTRKLLEMDETSQPEDSLYRECTKIVERLRASSPVQTSEAIRPYTSDKEFSMLADSIRESINKDKPELALDRLHTFTVKYVRTLCDRRGIDYDRSIPLHGLFGMYVKLLRREGEIESEMTERILRSSISILESFNRVRNERSLAHDNPLLGHNEALLVLNIVSASIKFLEAIEDDEYHFTDSDDSDVLEDEIPF